mmetsp:Transcript_57825/g.116187  ORF Transcript_57825/g.116187 Transcript_57825/m.116187 type:complete len:295 (+) Transcript_57825:493-1377(+)
MRRRFTSSCSVPTASNRAFWVASSSCALAMFSSSAIIASFIARCASNSAADPPPLPPPLSPPSEQPPRSLLLHSSSVATAPARAAVNASSAEAAVPSRPPAAAAAAAAAAVSVATCAVFRACAASCATKVSCSLALWASARLAVCLRCSSPTKLPYSTTCLFKASFSNSQSSSRLKPLAAWANSRALALASAFASATSSLSFLPAPPTHSSYLASAFTHRSLSRLKSSPSRALASRSCRHADLSRSASPCARDSKRADSPLPPLPPPPRAALPPPLPPQLRKPKPVYRPWQRRR